jgi:tripartite-type tricarboxylate transporter receptor subunit TctC
MISKRKLIGSAFALAAVGFTGTSLAQPAFPNKMIKIVVGNAAGGTDDAISRFVAEKISKELGQPVVVDNRGGGATTIAGAYVSQAPADGYTLFCLINTAINQTLLRDKLPYKLSSFVPVAGVGGFPLALAVSGTTPTKITKVDELVAASRAKDGVTFASGGVGSMGHLNGVRFLNVVKGQGVHVTYKNNPEGLNALMGGFTQMMFASVSEVAALRGDGKLRVLAVTAPQRSSNMPDVPTMQELGYPDFEVALWHGFVAPAGTPPDVVAKLAGAISRAVKDPEFTARFKPLAFQEDLRTGKELASFIDGSAARWKKVIVDNKIQIE